MIEIESFNSGLKQFIIDNGIIGATAGVCVGLATKDIINSLVGDIIIPVLVIVFYKAHLKQFTKLLPGKGAFDFISFFKHLITWFIVLIITFLFLKATFQKFLGVPLSKSDSQPSSNNQIKKPVI
jgi:large-conductance mechanosensitive channel